MLHSPSSAGGGDHRPNVFTETIEGAARTLGARPAGREAPARPQLARPFPARRRPPRVPAVVRRHGVAAAVALVLLLQVVGTIRGGWTPGLFIHGGLDRIIDYLAADGLVIAAWLQRALDVTLCLYWAVVLIACSGLACDVAPVPVGPELRWSFHQRRTAYVPAFASLTLSHLIGAVFAFSGWWVLAVPFELGGHAGMAVLLYVMLVPEARRKLVIIEDPLGTGTGTGSRLHLSSGAARSGRRWITIPRDHLRRIDLLDPLWARLLGIAHIELTYLDADMTLRSQVLRGIGSKRELAFIVAKVSGQNWRPRMVMHAFPGAPGRQPPFRRDEGAMPV